MTFEEKKSHKKDTCNIVNSYMWQYISYGQCKGFSNVDQRSRSLPMLKDVGTFGKIL